MTRKTFLLGLLAVLILLQLPFAYRRYRLSKLNQAIHQLATQRVSQSPESEYLDYQGVIHVHSSLGGHSTGNFAELISAARANRLDFVIMTEHPQADFDTAAMTLSGMHAGVLFVNGNEANTASGDHLLLIPGSENASLTSAQSTAEVVDKQKTSGGLALAAYPSESQNWQSSSVNGVEVYNLFTNARAANPLVMFFDGLWSYGSYPDLMFADFFTRPTENLKRWDDAIAANNRKLVATAGNDAHSNVGLSVNDASGKQWLGIKLDPYQRSFRVVRVHVLIRKSQPLTRESLLEAISQGHCYVSFDLFADPRGFSFAVKAADKRIMGDEIASANGMVLTATAPFAARFVLFKNGSPSEQKSGTSAEFALDGKGSYRLEVYLDSLPPPARGALWIISNPIYVSQ